MLYLVHLVLPLIFAQPLLQAVLPADAHLLVKIQHLPLYVIVLIITLNAATLEFLPAFLVLLVSSEKVKTLL